MNTKKCLSLSLLFASLITLSSCGYRGSPRPEKGVETTYPRQYPKPESAYPADDDLF